MNITTNLSSKLITVLLTVAAAFGVLIAIQPLGVGAASANDPAGDICRDVQEGTWKTDGGADEYYCDTGDGGLFGEGGVFRNITGTLIFLTGAISVIMLIIGGIRYTVSGGDQNAVTGAKNTILYAIVGLIVSFMAYAIVNFVIGNL